MTLNQRIKVLGIALLCGSFLTIYLVMAFVAHPELEDQAIASANQTVKNTKNEIEKTLTEAAVLTSSLAALSETLPLEKERFIETLAPIIDQYDNQAIAGGGIWPEPGKLTPGKQRDSLFWARNAQGELALLDDYNDPQGSGYHNEGWYQAGRGLSPGTCAWSEAYQDPVSGIPMVTCTMTITRDGVFWGVATIDLMLSGLNGLMRNQNEVTGGYTLVIDQTDRIVTFPDIRSEDLSMQQLDGVIGSHPGLSPLKPALNQTDPSYLPEGVVPGDRSLVVQSPLEEQGWTVAMILPESKALSALRRVSSGLYLTLIPLVTVFVAVVLLLGRRLIKSIQETTRQVNSLSEGQRGNKLSIARQDEVGALRQAVNDYGTHLEGILERIAQEAGEVKSGADNLHALSNTLNGRASDQMKENMTLASAVHQMSASASEVATNTSTTADTAEDASRIVQEGQDAVSENGEAIGQLARAMTEASSVISKLADDSQKVGSVLEVIKTISEQTNLLALNAAIEAARAGEQGRGFAVVADEVRSLAAKTQDSANEIDTMIHELQEAAKQGVEVIDSSYRLSEDSVSRAEKVRECFDNIVSAFDNIKEHTVSIAAASEEQASVTEEITQLAERIRGISELTAQDASELQNMSSVSTEQAQRLAQISKHEA